MFSKPNLFTYATSELSQDAFICWLLAWADPAHQVADGALHTLSQAFIQALYKKRGNTEFTLPDITKLSVRRQVKNIDILCLINIDKPTSLDKEGYEPH